MRMQQLIYLASDHAVRLSIIVDYISMLGTSPQSLASSFLRDNQSVTPDLPYRIIRDHWPMQSLNAQLNIGPAKCSVILSSLGCCLQRSCVEPVITL